MDGLSRGLPGNLARSPAPAFRLSSAILRHLRRANFQPDRTNTILGPNWLLLHGELWAWARLGGVDVCFGPGSFMQVGPAVLLLNGPCCCKLLVPPLLLACSLLHSLPLAYDACKLQTHGRPGTLCCTHLLPTCRPTLKRWAAPWQPCSASCPWAQPSPVRGKHTGGRASRWVVAGLSKRGSDLDGLAAFAGLACCPR